MKKGLLISFLGLATGVLCLFEFNRRKQASENKFPGNALQRESLRLLERTRVRAFAGSEEKLALALGRPLDEIREWTNGAEIMDADARMKVHALAMQRGVSLH